MIIGKSTYFKPRLSVSQESNIILEDHFVRNMRHTNGANSEWMWTTNQTAFTRIVPNTSFRNSIDAQGEHIGILRLFGNDSAQNTVGIARQFNGIDNTTSDVKRLTTIINVVPTNTTSEQGNYRWGYLNDSAIFTSDLDNNQMDNSCSFYYRYSLDTLILSTAFNGNATITTINNANSLYNIVGNWNTYEIDLSQTSVIYKINDNIIVTHTDDIPETVNVGYLCRRNDSAPIAGFDIDYLKIEKI